MESALKARIHVPVLMAEVLQSLQPQPGQVLVDGTLGAGGHTLAMAEKLGDSGIVLSLDRDPEALAAAEINLKGRRVMVAQSNFCDLPEVLAEVEIPHVHGILLVLGLSSDQLADHDRGFSFDAPGPLDLRFDPAYGEPAYRLINRLSAENLSNIIHEFGEERFARRIARAIVEQRKKQPIETATDLAQLLRRVIPHRPHGERINPATRTFQALRIAVNDELRSLEIALRRLPDCLEFGGRLAIISYHSLEDRRVKEAFRNDPRLEILTLQPIRPSQAEVSRNPRSRSAKLRVARRTDA